MRKKSRSLQNYLACRKVEVAEDLTDKKYIVLDLFVIHAIASNDLDLYFKTGSLLQFIKDKCHKIVLSPALRKEYVTRLERLRREGYINDPLFKYLKRILTDSEKISEAPDLAYDIPVDIPVEDQLVVKTALAKRGNTIIVTTDEKHLLANTKLKEFLRREKIVVLHLNEAISVIVGN